MEYQGMLHNNPTFEDSKESKVVNCKALTLRSEPDKETGKVLEIMVAGTIITIESDVNEDWCKVKTTSGKEGYVMKSYVE